MEYDQENDLSNIPQPLAMSTPDSTLPRKLPIPRASRDPDSAVAVGQRVKRACAACKESKAKCSGAQPCHRCVGLDLVCEFNEGKRQFQARYVHGVVATIRFRRLTEPEFCGRPRAKSMRTNGCWAV